MSNLSKEDEILVDVLYQACWDEKHDYFSSGCLSAYASALYYLEEKNIMYFVGEPVGRAVITRLYERYKNED